MPKRGLYVAALILLASWCIANLFQCSSGSAVGSQGERLSYSEDVSTKFDVKQIPDTFDWQSYIAYHPDVFNIGIVNEEAAKEHFLKEGGVEGLLYHRLNVSLRYTACTEIVLPPAAVRDSFANYFSVFKERNEVLWSATPLSDLLDEQAIIDYWDSQGVVMHKAVSLDPFPDLTQPHAAYVPYPASNAEQDCSVQMDNVYSGIHDLADVIAQARGLVVEKAESLENETPGRHVDTVVLDLPCTFFMMRTASNKRLVSTVARSLKWSPQMLTLAEKVIQGIKRNHKEGDNFNALHLRIEKDARDWVQTMGGPEAIWRAYIETMQQAAFQGDEDVYIASGLLTYGAENELAEKIRDLQKEGLCQNAHYKELYLTATEMEGLNSEQKALIDFLVLKDGHRFVGFGTSTFSFYIRELRLLDGVPKQRSRLVDASAIGTDGLFSEAATLS